MVKNKPFVLRLLLLLHGGNTGGYKNNFGEVTQLQKMFKFLQAFPLLKAPEGSWGEGAPAGAPRRPPGAPGPGLQPQRASWKELPCRPGGRGELLRLLRAAAGPAWDGAPFSWEVRNTQAHTHPGSWARAVRPLERGRLSSPGTTWAPCTCAGSLGVHTSAPAPSLEHGASQLHL